MKILEAFSYASQLHAGHVDLAGRPYIDHLSRVCRAVQERGGSIYQQIASLFHDALEDGKATVDELLAAGVPRLAVDLVLILTRRHNETYAQYILRVSASPDAALIKQADIEDNLQPERLGLLDAAKRDGLKKRYSKALEALACADGLSTSLQQAPSDVLC